MATRQGAELRSMERARDGLSAGDVRWPGAIADRSVDAILAGAWASRRWATCSAAADQLRGKLPKLGALMDGAEHAVLPSMNFSRAHWLQIHSTNPPARLNAEIQRRTHVVGIFPNDTAVTRPVGAMLREQNDAWRVNRRSTRLESLQTLPVTALARLPAVQRCGPRSPALPGSRTHATRWDTINFAGKVARRVVFRHASRIHAMGPPNTLFAEPQTAELKQLRSALH